MYKSVEVINEFITKIQNYKTEPEATAFKELKRFSKPTLLLDSRNCSQDRLAYEVTSGYLPKKNCPTSVSKF